MKTKAKTNLVRLHADTYARLKKRGRFGETRNDVIDRLLKETNHKPPRRKK